MRPSVFSNLLYVAAVFTVGLLVAWTAAAPGGMSVIQQQGLFGGEPSTTTCDYGECTAGYISCRSIDSNCIGSVVKVVSTGTSTHPYYIIEYTYGDSCYGLYGYDCSYIDDEWCSDDCMPPT